MSKQRNETKRNEQLSCQPSARSTRSWRKVAVLAVAASLLLGGRRTGGCNSPGRTLILRQTNTGRQIVLAFDPIGTQTLPSFTPMQFRPIAADFLVTASAALDTSSRLMVFDAPLGYLSTNSDVIDSAIHPNWVGANCRQDRSCYVQPAATALLGNAAEVHYPLGDSEGFYAQALWSVANPWPNRGVNGGFAPTVSAARNYDRGICDIVLPWATLDSAIGPAVLAQVLQTVRANPNFSSFRDTSLMHSRYAAVLQHTTDGSDRDDDFIAMNFTQVVRFFNSQVTPEVIAGTQLWLTPQLTRIGTGANTLSFNLRLGRISDPGLDYEPRFAVTVNASQDVATALSTQLPAQISKGLSDRLRIIAEFPPDRAPNVPPQQVFACRTNVPSDLMTACARFIDAFTPSTQLAYECVPWTELSNTQQRLVAYRRGFCSLADALVPRADIGVCAVRVGPTRIQVLPEGLQLVMLDSRRGIEARNLSFIVNTVMQPLIQSGSQELIASCDVDRAEANRQLLLSGTAPTHVTNLTETLGGVTRITQCATPSQCNALADSATAPLPFFPPCG